MRVLTFLFLAASLAAALYLLAGQWEALGPLRAGKGTGGWSLSPGWLSAALALGVANLLWMATAWVRLYRGGGGRLDRWEGIRAWLATNLGRYIPGKLWQVTGLAVHLRSRGGSGAVALGSLLTFQILTLLTAAAIALATLGGDLLRTAGTPIWALLPGALVLASALHPSVVRRLVRTAARLLGEPPGEARAAPGRALAGAAGALLAAWIVYGAGFWCLLAGLLEAPPPSATLLTGVFAAGYLAGYLVLVAPGGLVVREGAITGLLVASTPLGAATAAALAVAARIWVTLSELVGLGLVLLPSGFRREFGPSREATPGEATPGQEGSGAGSSRNGTAEGPKESAP